MRDVQPQLAGQLQCLFVKGPVEIECCRQVASVLHAIVGDPNAIDQALERRQTGDVASNNRVTCVDDPILIACHHAAAPPEEPKRASMPASKVTSFDLSLAQRYLEP